MKARPWIAVAASLAVIRPLPAVAAAPPAPVVQPDASGDAFSTQQIDALVAPVALYPDQLLTQVLIAATFPLQVVEAMRWLDDPAHKDLKGDALTQALAAEAWDPSVKSLVPFPQVLSQLNNNLEWTQQLGYAFANQQKDVLDSVQRLRRQAQSQGHLQSTPQQTVRTEPPPTGSSAAPSVVIEPAQPDVVYVPSYDPNVVYGAWPYPSYPPVAAVPGSGYVAGSALLGGLAFGTGVAVTSALWGWSRPNWYRGDVNVNVNRWNNINVNRQRTVSSTWSPALNRGTGQSVALQRPPHGPVGAPMRHAGLPAGAIGRPSVRVPANLVSHPPAARPGGPAAGDRPNLSPGSRPAAPPQNRPQPAAGGRPAGHAPANRPHPNVHAQGRAGGPAAQPQHMPPRAPGAFAGMGEGNRAAAFQQRGAQSRASTGGTSPNVRAGGDGSHPGGGARPAEGNFHRGGGGPHGGFHGRR